MLKSKKVAREVLFRSFTLDDISLCLFISIKKIFNMVRIYFLPTFDEDEHLIVKYLLLEVNARAKRESAKTKVLCLFMAYVTLCDQTCKV